ncbi:MAG: hypothetical protein AAB425_01600 [Bdellovibrionota bacterium]
MWVIFILAKSFPFWAIAISIACVDIGRYYRRLRRNTQHVYWGSVILLGVLTLLWIFFRGDLHSDKWVKAVIGDYGN